ncbi:MAG: hypothetical protein HY238_07890 [Acidobacteria bacterium]|nr:hypothetical protein [Acidobacteriota bacterium]
MTIHEVKAKYEEQLMRLPNVTLVGVGQRGGKLVIRVGVTHKVPESALRQEDIVPKALDGVEVDVEESGPIEAQTP